MIRRPPRSTLFPYTRSSDLGPEQKLVAFVMEEKAIPRQGMSIEGGGVVTSGSHSPMLDVGIGLGYAPSAQDRKSTRLNSSHSQISYAVFCLKKKKQREEPYG